MEKKNLTYSAIKGKQYHKQRYSVAGTYSSKILDELACYAVSAFNTKIAVINFVDQHDIWPKKGQPIDKLSGVFTETNVCSIAFVNEIEAYLNISFDEFIASPALATNAMVAAEFGMRFYAAAPITTDDGVQIGTVCILDRLHREFLPGDREKLTWIAEMVKKQMNKRVAKKLCA